MYGWRWNTTGGRGRIRRVSADTVIDFGSLLGPSRGTDGALAIGSSVILHVAAGRFAVAPAWERGVVAGGVAPEPLRAGGSRRPRTTRWAHGEAVVAAASDGGGGHAEGAAQPPSRMQRPPGLSSPQEREKQVRMTTMSRNRPTATGPAAPTEADRPDDEAHAFFPWRGRISA